MFNTNDFPVIDMEEGGSINGVVKSLNQILDITVPEDKQEGGTYVIPGHGRLTDEADVVEYRDMMTIIRDRVQDAIDKGMTLEQVKAARLVRDYEGRYGAARGAGHGRRVRRSRVSQSARSRARENAAVTRHIQVVVMAAVLVGSAIVRVGTAGWRSRRRDRRLRRRRRRTGRRSTSPATGSRS